MKSETITVKACEVRKGDVTPWGVAETNAVGYSHGKDSSWNIGGAAIIIESDKTITVSRPLPDPCPRGMMVIDSDGDIDLQGLNFRCSVSGRQISPAKAAAARRIVALWNAAEREPYRTTEEIEASNTKTPR